MGDLVDFNDARKRSAGHRDTGLCACSSNIRLLCRYGCVADLALTELERMEVPAAQLLRSLHESRAVDPCGGSQAGGDGCRCDPPFGH